MSSDKEIKLAKQAILDHYHEGHAKHDYKYYEGVLHDDWKFFMHSKDLKLDIIDKEIKQKKMILRRISKDIL